MNHFFITFQSIKLKGFLLLLLLSSVGSAQNIPVGTWRNHSDYSNGRKVAELGSKIFCATEGGLFYFDTEDGSINTLSITSGLNGIEISTLQSTSEKDFLFIGYKDGTLDIINKTLEINSFAVIKNSEMLGSKAINNITTKDNITYLATDFGVVLYDVEQNRVIDSYTNLNNEGNPLAINHLSIDDEYLYLSTSEGLLQGSLDPQVNLKDFQNWNRLPISSKGDVFSIMKTVKDGDNNLLALAENNIVYRRSAQSWDTAYISTDVLHNLVQEDNKILLLDGSSVYEYNNNTFPLLFSDETSLGFNDLLFFRNTAYIADSNRGLLQYQQGSFQPIEPQGPKGFPNILRQIEGYTFSMNDEFPGFSYFINGKWNHVGEDVNDNPLPLFIDVAIDLLTGNGIFLSKEDGIYSWDTNEISLASISLDNSEYKWEKLATGSEAKLWVAGRNSLDEIVVYNITDNKLYETGLNTSLQIRDFEIAFNGDKYFATNNGLVVFNESEGGVRILNNVAGNGSLPANSITDLAIDLSGTLWIGTTEGVCFFNNFTSVLSGESVNVIKPIFEGFFLFNGVAINNIAIDGGNRKWITTNDGLWLFDENINENIVHFESNNSPIMNENIRQLVINPLNGEVFLSSATQFISYRTDATQASETHSAVEVFPNPVSLSAHSSVTIRGLAYNNEVMITDLAGNLIQKGKANGGTFSWSLSNYSGFRIKKGVYLVFSINSDGTETYRTKFAVVY
ncbi:hypothetical protein GCM10011506_43940 [Marivirga lumbricoides]|uniref:PorZ N-terminal beta-propeller domain-containing protein n=1 Tax=Marivirga lumbricoides TaxID=1046115 RepID=A0ABQ1N4M6_9BACT|nr:hypothetical protein GCM10011506_43940 [Marivirga lumbricoides]